MAICAQDAPLLEPVMTVAEDDGDTAADDPATLSARSRVECAPSLFLLARFKQCLCRPCFCFVDFVSPFPRSLRGLKCTWSRWL